MKIDMSKFFVRACAIVSERIHDEDSCHFEACSQLCDEFRCWDLQDRPHGSTEPKLQVLPHWVMYLVSGIMRNIADHREAGVR